MKYVIGDGNWVDLINKKDHSYDIIEFDIVGGLPTESYILQDWKIIYDEET